MNAVVISLAIVGAALSLAGLWLGRRGSASLPEDPDHPGLYMLEVQTPRTALYGAILTTVGICVSLVATMVSVLAR